MALFNTLPNIFPNISEEREALHLTETEKINVSEQTWPLLGMWPGYLLKQMPYGNTCLKMLCKIESRLLTQKPLMPNISCFSGVVT